MSEDQQKIIALMEARIRALEARLGETRSTSVRDEIVFASSYAPALSVWQEPRPTFSGLTADSGGQSNTAPIFLYTHWCC